MVITGNGELGFGAGEGAWEMATTITIGSRRETYPILTNRKEVVAWNIDILIFKLE